MAEADLRAAADQLIQALNVFRKSDIRSETADSLEALACLAAANGQMDRVLRLAGAAASMRETSNLRPSAADQGALDEVLDGAQAAAGGRADAFWMKGHRLTFADAVEYASLSVARRLPRSTCTAHGLLGRRAAA